MSQSNKQKRKKKQSSLKKINHYAAGIDVGATEIWVAVDPKLDQKPVRKFYSFTADLKQLADWLISCKVKTVAMEATGVYWIPLFQILESYGIEACLVNARHVKSVTGRKSDLEDCQWLQQLHSYGLLRSSFRPADEVCALRSIMRHRDNLIKSASRYIQHMQKALTQMNVQIHNIISDITGLSGMTIIKAILAGERDPIRLAGMCDRRIKASMQTVAKSLEGDYRGEHLFCLEQALESYEFTQKQLIECDNKMEQMLIQFQSSKELVVGVEDNNGRRKYKAKGNQPIFDVVSQLERICGVDLSKVPGISSQVLMVIFSELGPNFLERFATVKHFCSWLGLCPENRISGGRVLSSKTRKVKNRLARALRMGASSLQRVKNEMGDYFRRMRAKLGAPGAITATAHKIARILYALIRDCCNYDPKRLNQRNQSWLRRKERSLRKQADAMGYDLVARQNPSSTQQQQSVETSDAFSTVINPHFAAYMRT